MQCAQYQYIDDTTNWIFSLDSFFANYVDTLPLHYRYLHILGTFLLRVFGVENMKYLSFENILNPLMAKTLVENICI